MIPGIAVSKSSLETGPVAPPPRVELRMVPSSSTPIHDDEVCEVCAKSVDGALDVHHFNRWLKAIASCPLLIELSNNGNAH